MCFDILNECSRDFNVKIYKLLQNRKILDLNLLDKNISGRKTFIRTFLIFWTIFLKLGAPAKIESGSHYA